MLGYSLLDPLKATEQRLKIFIIGTSSWTKVGGSTAPAAADILASPRHVLCSRHNVSLSALSLAMSAC